LRLRRRGLSFCQSRGAEGLIRIGQVCRDKITGFEGVVTARYEFINGCIRFLLERLNKEGSVEELVFDEQRLEVIAEKFGEILPDPPLRRTGGPRNKAPRTGTR
jgi:hypothetical protein